MNSSHSPLLRGVAPASAMAQIAICNVGFTPAGASSHSPVQVILRLSLQIDPIGE